MSMNSFSLRAQSPRSNRPAFESEISGLLNLHPEGEVFSADAIRNIHSQPFRPLDLESLKALWKDSNGRRNAPRYEALMTVLIVTHFKAFRTQSLNLSASGLYVKDLLPDGFDKYKFDIVLIHAQENGTKNFLLFQGRAIRSIPSSQRVRFEAMTPDSVVKLESLLRILKPSA